MLRTASLSTEEVIHDTVKLSKNHCSIAKSGTRKGRLDMSNKSRDKQKEIEAQEDKKLLKLAEERLETVNLSLLISQEEIDEKFGVKAVDYSDLDDIEFE